MSLSIKNIEKNIKQYKGINIIENPNETRVSHAVHSFFNWQLSCAMPSCQD